MSNEKEPKTPGILLANELDPIYIDIIYLVSQRNDKHLSMVKKNLLSTSIVFSMNNPYSAIESTVVL